jgi:hypothetical protein
MIFRWAIALALAGFLADRPAGAKSIVLDCDMHHLRAAGPREWSDFPPRPEGPSLSVRFKAERNDGEWTLRLRQQDIKQTWKILLNGEELGRLVIDENDQILCLPVAAGRLRSGENQLRIEQVGRVPDDVRVGEIHLDDRPLHRLLSEAAVEVSVREAGPRGETAATPCRLTILNAQGALAALGAVSDGHLAVRPGVIYSGDGKARFGLPAGDYTLHAGRGFEYGIDTIRITLRPGDTVRRTLTIHREAPTGGYISCDTHVHTLTYSGHGDASTAERVLTLAGEGIELPIATDHNRQVDYRDAAVQQGVGKYFTLVTGNEVTTAVGHFNIWPVRAGGPLPDAAAKDWKSVFASIAERTGAKVVILNHPRDLHSGFRPFGPKRHLALTGERLDGWELRANGMEVVNSGAQQTDVMQPYHDWFGLLNRGVLLTPAGASDSHTVSYAIVGQARTYIRCPDDRPGDIDVSEAAKNFAAGRVLVSCGLLADITVNDRYGPGDLVPVKGEVKVTVHVRGPSWATADKVELYANGIKLREARIADGTKAGTKWQGEWTLPPFRHDAHLTAIASGPGVRELYWPIARPYQPTSPVVKRRVLGSTGAVWLDADGDGERTSAFTYAQRLLGQTKGAWSQLVRALSDYDEAVAAQAASLLQARGVSASAAEVRAAARQAGDQVERGFQAYTEAWRASQMARDESR